MIKDSTWTLPCALCDGIAEEVVVGSDGSKTPVCDPCYATICDIAYRAGLDPKEWRWHPIAFAASEQVRGAVSVAEQILRESQRRRPWPPLDDDDLCPVCRDWQCHPFGSCERKR